MILDPLEPRVLLNADTMLVQLASLPNASQAHDVLVQMVNQTIVVGTQTQVVQRVQVVDAAAGNAILAVGDLSEIRAVAIAAGTGTDKITLNLDSFGAFAAPLVKVDGNGLTAVAISHRAGQIDWQVNADGSGDAAGAASPTFIGVDALSGGGADVLHGPSADTTWQVTGVGSGSFATQIGGAVTTFSGFAQLDAAPGTRNAFDMHPGRSLAQGVVGGGAFDTLAYVGGDYANVVAAPASPDSGSLTADGVITRYAGVAPAALPMAANVTLDLNSGGDSLTLADVAGTTNEIALSDTFEGATQIATVPTGTLTVDLGNLGNNTLTVTGSDGRLAGTNLVIQSEGTGDTIIIAGNLKTGDGSFSADADMVTVNAADTIDTRGTAGGASGAITINAMNMSMAAGSALRADAVGTGGTAGNVTVAVADTALDGLFSPFNDITKVVTLDLEGATIDGGTINISATNTDLNPSSPLGIAYTALGDIQTILSAFPSIPSIPSIGVPLLPAVAEVKRAATAGSRGTPRAR